jgi:mannose-1-phosphate guanylyltransferase
MSYHSHDLRDEVWTVLSGSGKTVIDGMEQIVNPGDVVTMAAGCKHTIIANSDLTILETQIGETISKSDKEKFEFNDDAIEGSI